LDATSLESADDPFEVLRPLCEDEAIAPTCVRLGSVTTDLLGAVVILDNLSKHILDAEIEDVVMGMCRLVNYKLES
jgi:cytolysin (calcineurin-like family phosphatase)